MKTIRTRFIALAVLLAAPALHAASIQFAGTLSNDPGSQISQWRTAGTAKTMDADGDNLYGTTARLFHGVGLFPAGAPYVMYFTQSVVGPGARNATVDHPNGGADLQVGTSTNGGAGVGEQEMLRFTAQAGGPVNVRIGIATDGLDAASLAPVTIGLRQAGGASAEHTLTAVNGTIDMVFFDVAGVAAGDYFEVFGDASAGGFATHHFVTWDVRPPLVVTSTADSGTGSLRAVLATAAGTAGPDVITFDPAVFTRATAATNTITLTSAELVVGDTAGVTIDATAIPGGVTLSGSNARRLFTVAAGGNLDLRGLTLTGGNPGANDGGAILNEGKLSLTNCTLTGNACAAGGGGGGAIRSSGAGSALALTHCTVTGNTGNYGGGIFASNGTMSFVHATISGNTSRNASQTAGLILEGGTATLSNCILAGNIASAGTGDIELGGSGTVLTVSGVNLLGVPSTFYPTGLGAGLPNGSGQFVGTLAAPLDPKLGPLARNGGPTQTRLPLPDSLARDRIANSTLTTDQRGTGFPRVLWGRADVGAVEAGIHADCAWEVVQAFRSPATTVGSVAQAEALLTDPTATRVLATVGVINFNDLNGGAGGPGFFGGDVLFPLDNQTPQGLLNGNDDDFATRARGFITIATEADYTFGFSSDDGARLRLLSTTGGADPQFSSSTRLNTANPANPAHSLNTLSFDGGTGNSDTLGVVHLLPGTYGVEFLTWDGGFGAYAEVFAASGARTAVDQNFRLIGDVAAPGQLGAGTLSAAAWTVTHINNGASTFAAALSQITQHWCGVAQPGTTVVNNVDTINYRDPQSGGGGHGLAQLNFPGNTAADDNNFALGARATLTVPDDDDYTFHVLADDSVRLRIKGSRGWTITGGTSPQALPDGFQTINCCADVFGQVYLTAGSYEVELIYHEFVSGAYAGVWAAQGKHSAYHPRSFSLLGNPPAAESAVPFALTSTPGATGPVNDDFAAALPLTGTMAAVTSCNIGATLESGEPATGSRTKSVWWTWTAPAAGPVVVDTIGSNFDTVLAVLTGTSVSALTQVGFDDASGGSGASRLSFTAAAGTSYRLQVSGYNSAEGRIRLNLAPAPAAPAAPANDAFASATDLGSVLSFARTGTTLAATKETGEPNHAGDTGGASVWFTWTPPASGRYLLDTRESGFDTLLAVYTGTAVNSLAAVASNDDGGGGGTSLIRFTAVAGTPYRIAVDGISARETSWFLTLVPVFLGLPSTVTTLEDTTSAPIPLTVGEAATETSTRTITATSNNTGLVPNANVTFGGACSARTVTVTPTAGRSGTATITLQTIMDGAAVTTSFALTVQPVNDAPSFTLAGPDLPALTAGSRTVPGWATGLSAGPADESGQTLTFLVSTTNPGLFTSPPALSPAGGLTFATAAGPGGTATVTVRLRDNGSTANGGQNTSAPQTFTITVVTPVVSNADDPGPGSLSQFIALADATTGPQQAIFDPSLSGAFFRFPGEIIITDPAGVVLDATGLPGGLLLRGNLDTRHFSISPGASLTLRGITVSDGRGDGAVQAHEGGSILNRGRLTVDRCTFDSNSSDCGAAIYNASGATATITSSTISNNTAAFDGGGGIFNLGSLTMTHCTVAGNRATISGGGGGIRNLGILNLNHSIVAGNTGGDIIGSAPTGGNNITAGDPKLSFLHFNGGPTSTLALLPGSPALNPAATVPPDTTATDQRGFPIVGTPDIGAYEQQPYIPLTYYYSTHSENFDTLPTASTAWADHALLNGWQAQMNNGATPAGTLQASDGSTVLNGLLNCGATGSSDRALGSKATSTGNFANIACAAVFRNVSNSPVRFLRLRYAEELWRSGAASQAEKVTVFYALSADPLASILSGTANPTAAAGAGFLPLPAGASTSIANAGTGILDGNAAANRSTVDFTLTAGTEPVIQPGQYFTLKWTDPNEAGTDGHQAIDDVIVDFTPATNPPLILGTVGAAPIQGRPDPLLFSQSALNQATMAPGTGVFTTDQFTITPGTEKCLSLTVAVQETSASSGMEAADKLKVELLTYGPLHEIETLTSDYDINQDGFLTGGPTPLADEFNLQQQPDANTWNSTLLLVGTIPSYATSFQLRITGTIDGQPTLPATEIYRFQNATLTDCVDTDRDGISDAWEAAHGTNPNSAASRFHISAFTGNATTTTLTVPGLAGRTYQLLCSPDLLTWTRDGLPAPGTGADLPQTRVG